MEADMSSTSITARIEPETKEKLEALAAATQRSKSWLVADAVRAYVEEQSWQVEAIRQGLAAIDAGDFADEAEVEALFQKYSHHAR
jgi:RHH-type transcriptional regulator, rel operon repressor / antitoxin RelB